MKLQRGHSRLVLLRPELLQLLPGLVKLLAEGIQLVLHEVLHAADPQLPDPLVRLHLSFLFVTFCECHFLVSSLVFTFAYLSRPYTQKRNE